MGTDKHLVAKFAIPQGMSVQEAISHFNALGIPLQISVEASTPVTRAFEAAIRADEDTVLVDTTADSILEQAESLHTLAFLNAQEAGWDFEADDEFQKAIEGADSWEVLQHAAERVRELGL